MQAFNLYIHVKLCNSKVHKVTFWTLFEDLGKARGLSHSCACVKVLLHHQALEMMVLRELLKDIPSLAKLQAHFLQSCALFHKIKFLAWDRLVKIVHHIHV